MYMYRRLNLTRTLSHRKKIASKYFIIAGMSRTRKGSTSKILIRIKFLTPLKYKVIYYSTSIYMHVLILRLK